MPTKKTKQSQPLRIEMDGYLTFATSKTENSRLWLIDKKARDALLQIIVKNINRSEVPVVHALSIQGNHYHMIADFKKRTRASFFRNVNSHAAHKIKAINKQEKGPLFMRRYSSEAIDKESPQDVLEKIFYLALQGVLNGICKRATQDPGYNSFFHMIKGKPLQVIYFDENGYNEKKRYKRHVDRNEFMHVYEVLFARPPGFEDWPQDKFEAYMLEELRRREDIIIEEREKEGKGFMTLSQRMSQRVGAKPRRTKTSSRTSKRPLILTMFAAVKARFLRKYFEIYRQYKIAAKRYLEGDINAEFPPGTYRPPLCIVT